eukprot:scaffold159834_cov17-Tisochrysis_lutea.AAC.1
MKTEVASTCSEPSGLTCVDQHLQVQGSRKEQSPVVSGFYLMLTANHTSFTSSIGLVLHTVPTVPTASA